MPKVETGDILNITSNSVTATVNIIDEGEGIETYGLMASSNDSFDGHVNQAALTNPGGKGIFTCAINDLTSNTTYYLRAYATTAQETVYGKSLNFTTINGSSVYEAKYSLYAPTIDGQVNTSEWTNANLYSILLIRNDGIDTKQADLYLQHDGIWLYVGVKTTNNAGWDVYLALRFDGDNDNILNGSSSEPHTDINIEYPSPVGWDGYIRYDYLVSTNVYPTTRPSGTLSASYGSTNVNYEYTIKISDLNTGSGKSVGFYMFNLVDAIPEHGYEFPVRSAATDPSKWEHVYIQ